MRMCGEQHSDCFNRFVLCVTYVELLSLRLKPNIVLVLVVQSDSRMQSLLTSLSLQLGPNVLLG